MVALASQAEAGAEVPEEDVDYDGDLVGDHHEDDEHARTRRAAPRQRHAVHVEAEAPDESEDVDAEADVVHDDVARLGGDLGTGRVRSAVFAQPPLDVVGEARMTSCEQDVHGGQEYRVLAIRQDRTDERAAEEDEHTGKKGAHHVSAQRLLEYWLESFRDALAWRCARLA